MSLSNPLPLPYPYLPGDQRPDSFEDKVQQNMEALALAVGQLLNTSGLNGSRIVHGIVSSTGTATSNGFSAVRNSVGDYAITFDPQFSGAPTVTAFSRAAMPGGLSATPSETGASFRWRHNTTDALTDVDFHVIAVGPT